MMRGKVVDLVNIVVGYIREVVILYANAFFPRKRTKYYAHFLQNSKFDVRTTLFFSEVPINCLSRVQIFLV